MHSQTEGSWTFRDDFLHSSKTEPYPRAVGNPSASQNGKALPVLTKDHTHKQQTSQGRQSSIISYNPHTVVVHHKRFTAAINYT